MLRPPGWFPGSWTPDRRLADTPAIAEQSTADLIESERLARRWFAVVGRAAFDELPDLVHEEVRFVSRIRPGAVVEGRQEVSRYVAEVLTARLYEAVAEVYVPIDAERIAVEGRMRWMDDDRVIHDDPIVWAMAFRDELLIRSLPARSVIDAEALLAAEG